MPRKTESNMQEQYEYLLNYTVLPRFLPQHKPQNYHNDERKLLSVLVEMVNNHKEFVPPNTLEFFQRLGRLHNDLKPEIVSEQIRSLKPGKTFAMFVRRQNCALMIHMPKGIANDRVIVATFPGNFHPEHIYTTQSDIEMNYPFQSINVPYTDMIKSLDFAEQLCFFYQELPMEEKVRNYVSKWLLTVLADSVTETTEPDHFPIITKKFRDEMLGVDDGNFFRRSSFYNCAKVMLHHNLTVELGPVDAKILYKLIMLGFHTEMITVFNQYETLNLDLMSQALAKVARRIEKLPESGEKFEMLHEFVVSQAKTTISNISKRMNDQIDRIQREDEGNARLPPLEELDFELGINHKIPKLTEYLESRQCEKSPSRFGLTLHVKPIHRHNMNDPSSPNTSKFGLSSNEIDSHLTLADFENWVLYTLNMNQTAFKAEDLREWSFSYGSSAERFYEGDQLGISRMILVRLKLLAMLDIIACRAHPLYRDHRSGVNPMIINSLLLPQHRDMEIALDIQQFYQKRNEAAGATLLEEEQITISSFAAKFGEQNKAMQVLLHDISEIVKQKIDDKKIEWQKGRDLVAKLRSEQPVSCSFYTNYYGIERHDSFCKRCVKKHEIESVKVMQYERALPVHAYQQNAVCFELLCPIEISCLRDVLFEFATFCSATQLNPAKIQGNWTDYHQILQFNRSKSKRVHLDSTRSANLRNIHVDDSFDSFVVENAYNCMYHGGGRCLPPPIATDHVKALCTLNATQEYTCLQWTLTGTTHTQNQVLCRQVECPENMSLSEYIKFGSLRADGHRLQLRKMLKMIENESLSFEKSSVLALITQCLWEAGVIGDCGAIRASHDDFDDVKFADAMIEMLDQFCEKQKNNWVHPKKLLMTSFIAVRLFEINTNANIADKVVQLLGKIRAIALDWQNKIEKAISSIDNPNSGSEQELRMKLVDVSIAGAVTFFVHSKHQYFERIFANNSNGSSAPRVWLQFIITLNNNVLLNSKKVKLPQDLQMYLRLVRNIGIHIEPTIRSMIQDDTKDIQLLVKQQWSRAEKGVFQKFEFHQKCPQVLVFNVQLNKITNFVTIDIIVGNFLVNNLPVARLPNNITQSDLFQRVFGTFIFEVQPETQTRFVAVQKYNGCNYEFRRIGNENIITERTTYGIEKELIPHHILHDEIPNDLIVNYSHFWNKTEDVIEFRPKSFSDDGFSEKVEYELDLSEKRLKQLKTERFVIDITSESYRKIVQQLARLECSKYILIFMDKDNPRIAKAELVRMKPLNFVVDATKRHEIYDLVSNEYSGMRVSLEQKCGTLFGLQHGLLLESFNGNSHGLHAKSKKLLLVPHGEIVCEISKQHVSVAIDVESDLRKPSFFVYQVDDFCRQLKSNTSNDTAWFYLAYLHAVTSHGEIEPFIKMSGTERALQILQSGFAWSSRPYDAEALKLLYKIADLSPKREIKEHLQLVEWPDFIPPRSAQDSFVFIAQRLIEDSQQLHKLYDDKKDELAIDLNIQQNRRQYHRNLALAPNFKVSEHFIETEALTTAPIDIHPPKLSAHTRLMSIFYHRGLYKVPNDLDLKDFLMTHDKLDGPVNESHVEKILSHKVDIEFHNLWISLYNVARQGTLNREVFGLIWSLLTHEDKLSQTLPIFALQAIQMNAEHFQSIDPPAVGRFHPTKGTFKATQVEKILKSHHSLPRNYYGEKFEKKDYDRRIQKEIDHLTSCVTAEWPCDSIELKPYCTEKDINIENASKEISSMLKIWNNNRRLEEFIEHVESVLDDLPQSGYVNISEVKPIEGPEPIQWRKYEIDYNAKMCSQIDDYADVMKEATAICKGGAVTKSVDQWWVNYANIVNGPHSQHLIDAGMYPRIVPTIVLPQILNNNRLKPVIVALAISIVHEQRQTRIDFYSQNKAKFQVAKKREEQNEPHTNWKPYDCPEWLLFEIEQNLTIRSIQVDAAKHMMNPTNNKCNAKHSVMQLNMGEGKTAVIAPIVAAILANGKQACQITVLKSLFETNLKSYRQYLGGMLDRRIYLFPCRRDMQITQHISKLGDIYEECKQMQGIILTTPEWCLSFRLKIYESVQKRELTAASKFLTIHKWLNANIRSILDESDAILHPKYQLIYTLGSQLALDGGAHRWSCIQAVLKRVPHHMKKLHAECGAEKIEFDEKYLEKGQVFGAPKITYRSDVFTPCRILDSSYFDVLKSYLIEDFLNGDMEIAFPEMRQSTKDSLRRLLTEKNVNKIEFDAILSEFELSERNIIMVLSGLLRFEVLKLVLMRRWRVNYGVNGKGRREMAIPFKAKDVAAELTEFGHPDVALCFTHLSYYYSGLSNEQLEMAFGMLSRSQDADAIYNKWIESVPGELIDESIRSYKGVNLSDPRQRDTMLFPVFRYNMHIIDFFLANKVFPREAKTFEKKLMCSAWDLCSDHMQHTVTGFSGTNDTKEILPLPIAQNDLPALERTNEEVRETLLNSVNQDYMGLPANVSGKEIIELLVEREIPVLLDAGALILELTNLEVAKQWLALTSYDAAVYVDSRDIIQTIDRNDIIAEFDSSVYRDQLDRCLVYLDDVHTRGTDLKFPPNSKACVTLSGDITRDKTVQACMRMRQLKEEVHSIAFWASFEADLKIRSLCDEDPDHECVPNTHVIQFICLNSQSFETDNTVHWAAAAFNYTKKLIGHKLNEHSLEAASLESLLENCIDDEYMKLDEVYGDKEDALLAIIVNSKFEKLAQKFQNNDQIKKFIETVKNAARDKIMIKAPNVKRFVQALDEEQEKELENELEEERHIERPAAQTPAEPNFDQKLVELISTTSNKGVALDLMKRKTLVSFADGLMNTQLMKDFGIQFRNGWSSEMFITSDCVRVLSDTSCAGDEYLRPIWWVARVNVTECKPVFILLSSYECDRLKSAFKKSTNAVLYPFNSRLSKSSCNLLHREKLQVTGMTNAPRIDVHDEVQIGMYAGSMYFSSEAEQNAYCSFLGLVPQTRSKQHEEAFKKGLIKPNGFVLPEHRSDPTLADAVITCKFTKNPVDLALKLIKAHHHVVRDESHVASILERGKKSLINTN